ncbi:MAG TPA: N-acetylmuramoyl-L-alanine amidase [Gemmatimonadales bacterium]|nr:N-acetylmuramoyl-L-alanine amidase [Gemmatimonadales bacterium]
MRSQLSGLLLAAALGGALPAAAQRGLPPVPAVHGPLAITVRYPESGAAIAAGDSTFVYGTVGDGRARLTIDGQTVRVAANGAWLAWIAVPPDSAFALHLIASQGTDTARADWVVVRAGWVPERGAWIDRASLSPVGAVWLPAGEPLPLTVRAAPGASVRLLLPGGGVVLFAADSIAPPVADGIREFDRDTRNLVRPARGDRYVAVLRDHAGATSDACCVALDAPAVSTVAGPVLVVALGADTTRLPWNLVLNRTEHPVAVRLGDDPLQRGGGDDIITGRGAPTGTYTWFLPRGTRTEADARTNDQVRLRLAADAIAWVPLAAVQRVAAPDDARLAVMSSLTLTPDSSGARLRVPLTRPVPLNVSEVDGGLDITFFGVTSDANWTRYGAGRQFVKSLTWTQTSSDRITLAVRFAGALWGWRYRVDGTDLVFEFRQPPRIDPVRPLAGRLIVVDAGHPPGGACGPTHLCEPEANLAVAERVRDRLVALGARVVMTRHDSNGVALGARPALADSVGADLLISIHNNGLPDGVNPFTNAGSSTFFNHEQGLPLARMVQARLIAALGRRDLGVARGDLALVRPTWYPSIMTEALFMMVPEEENALRTPQGQAAYASAIVLGITDFLRAAAQSARGTAGVPGP